MSLLRIYSAPSLLGAVLLVAMTAACTPAEPSPSATAAPTPIATTIEPTVTAATPASTRTPKPEVPPDRETPSPTPTVDPSIAWTIGDPVPLPDGMTIVLGTGCWHCDGEFPTFVRFDATGITVLRQSGKEVHISGYFEDPEHLFLATCGEEDACRGPTDALTTLYESLDHGETWEWVMATPTLHAVRGRAPDGELLIDPEWPSDREMYFYPSGEIVHPPAGAVSEAPDHVGGSLVWRTADRKAIDEVGAVIADFSDVVPRGAALWHVLPVPDGGFFIVWQAEPQSLGAALVRGSEVVRFDGSPFAQIQASWLDSRTFLTSIEYPRDQLVEIPRAEHLVGQRIPTFVDLETRTLHPILEFLAADAPQGRNTIEAVWQD